MVAQPIPPPPPPPPPPTVAHVEVNPFVADEDMAPQIVDGLEQRKIELSPDGLWFDNYKIFAGVTTSSKCHYNHPYTNWGEVPHLGRDRWFNEFKRTYTWRRPEYDAKVRKAYERKVGDRLRDTMTKVAKLPLEYKIDFMIETVRE